MSVLLAHVYFVGSGLLWRYVIEIWHTAASAKALQADPGFGVREELEGGNFEIEMSLK